MKSILMLAAAVVLFAVPAFARVDRAYAPGGHGRESQTAATPPDADAAGDRSRGAYRDVGRRRWQGPGGGQGVAGPEQSERVSGAVGARRRLDFGRGRGLRLERIE